MITPPKYTDGMLRIYRTRNDDSNDYPETYLEDIGMKLWYRELSIYDRVRQEFEQNNKEITLKLRIPRFKGIDSKCVCIIEGLQHRVQNAAHVVDKNGFLETELTLIRPESELKIR